MQSVHGNVHVCVPLFAYTATQWSFNKVQEDTVKLFKYTVYACNGGATIITTLSGSYLFM